MKRNYSVFFLIFALLICFGSLTGYAKVKSVMADTITASEGVSGISSKSAILLDAESGTVIFSQNELEQRPIASMCKIMTLLLCFENIDNGNLSMTDKITVSDTAAGMGGSQVFLEANAEYSVEDLIKSITVASANDACVAMAETICGSEESFVVKMNDRAKELGMNNTVFTNCTGLPKVGQYSCAKDVAKMFSELIKHKDYFKFSGIWMDEINHPNDRVTEISNTNKLIRFYEGCDGGKTGYTREAGHCLCASAKRNDLRLICVVISSPDSKTRFKEVSSMFNFGFANFTNKVIVEAKSPLDFQVEIKGGKKDLCSVAPERSVYLFSKKGQKIALETEFSPCENVKAPIKAGDVMGKLTIYDNGKEIDCVNVISCEDIDNKTYFDSVVDITHNWGLAG